MMSMQFSNRIMNKLKQHSSSSRLAYAKMGISVCDARNAISSVNYLFAAAAAAAYPT